MKVRVEWPKTEDKKERGFEGHLDRFMAAQGFKRWASGLDIGTQVRDIAYERDEP